MGTKVNSNYEDLISFVRASGGGRATALRPVSYGTELVTNGDFSSSDGWTLKSNTTISGNQLTIDTTSDSSWYSNALRSDINIVAGKIYYYEVDIESQTPSDQLWIYIGGGSVTADAISLQGTGVITGVHIPTKSTSTLKVEDRHNTPSAQVINSISIKEVTFDQPDGTLTLFEHPENVPRVEYDADGNRLGLLVEEARTNLLTYSEDFTVQSGRWANGQKGDTSLTSGLTESPSMSDSVWKLFATSGTGTQIIQEDATVSGATNVVGSVYLKKAEYKYGGIRLLDSSPSTGYSVFIDLDDGSVFDTSTRGTPTTSDYRVQDAGNGWWRLSVITSSDGGSVNFTVGISDGTSINSFDCVSFAGDGTSGIYIWGAQVEEGSFPTSYIKSNSGSTTTRSADVASIPVADFGWSKSMGAFVIEGSSYNPASNRYFFEFSSDGSNRNASKAHSVQHVFVTFGGVPQASIDAGDISANTLTKVATLFKKDDFAAVVDGGSVATDTSGSVNLDVTDLKLGINRANGEPLNGHIKSIKYYPRRLTNAQLQDLTS